MGTTTTGADGEIMTGDQRLVSAAKLRRIQLRNAGDWNGEHAMRAWADGNETEYARLIRQADRLWAMAWLQGHQSGKPRAPNPGDRR